MYLPAIISNPEFSFREYRPNLLLRNANENAGLLLSFFILFITLNKKKKLKLFFIMGLFLVTLIFFNGSRYAIFGSFIMLRVVNWCVSLPKFGDSGKSLE